MILAVLTTETRAAKHSDKPIAGELLQRFSALRRSTIDFIPNASFSTAAVDLNTTEHSIRFLAGICGDPSEATAPRDLPAHLSRLCETNLLTPEVEAALFRQMNYLKFLASESVANLDAEDLDHASLSAIEAMLDQAREIRDHIIQANMRLVMSIVKKFVTPYQSFDEILSEGTITLMQAVEKFDFDRGFRFSTYAYRSISRTAYRFVISAREEESRVTRDAEEWAFGHTDEQQTSSMTDHLWNGLRDLTTNMLCDLDRRERFIIRSRYALGSHRRVRTFQDLANRLGVSKERVRQIEARAVNKLQTMAQEFDLDEIRLSVN